MVVLFLSCEHRFVGVWPHVLVEHEYELEVPVKRRYDPDDRGLFERERHLVSLVVPEMVNPILLSVVEVFLLAIQAKQVPMCVQS
jgi:hypothetical protein